MRAINHALTGALIGLTLDQPAIAMPVAFVSHFICDAIPHHGAKGNDAHILKSAWFKYSLFIDAALCGLVVLVLAISKPQHWITAAICAFLAASPDFASFNKFQRVRHDQSFKPSLFTRFAKRIQWFERPIGGGVEAAWLVAGVYLLSFFV